MGKNEDPGQHDKDRDLTAEMLEWAKDRIASAPKTIPGGVEPLDPAKEPPKEEEPAKEAAEESPTQEEAPTTPQEQPAKPTQEPKVLVVTLDENATQQGQAHFFDNSEEASHFIETLVVDGLDAVRIVVFHGTPMNVNVSYRPVVDIEQPTRNEPVAS